MRDMTPLMAKRRAETFGSEKARVITRLFIPGPEERVQHIIERVLALTEKQVVNLLDEVMEKFAYRHKNFKDILLRHHDEIARYLPEGSSPSPEKRLLLGAYFTHEYSVESAALFNPSMVLHPDQDGLKDRQSRFIMSFRATGEGHISSIEFRSGIIDEENQLWFDLPSRYLETPEVIKNPAFIKHQFELKLNEIGVSSETADLLLNELPARFSMNELQEAVDRGRDQGLLPETIGCEAVESMLWLAKSNYELKFSSDCGISERVIYPVAENESKGVEDARFVRFTDNDGSVTYYATYTAYNGSRILPQLIETKDFQTFKMMTLNGRAVQNKGMALFPRRINDKFVMLSRQDGENIHIMYSNNIYYWQESIILQEPVLPWEFIQIGNCGSPIETEAGWLVLTHGVGPMREYRIGAVLLKLDDPSRVIGRLDQPVLVANEHEREGYVPNVVYTCGSLIHNNELIVPYAMSDTASGIATLPLPELLSRLVDPICKKA